MIIFRTLDNLRSNIALFLTRPNENLSQVIDVPIKRILIVRPNHRLGNQLLLTPLLQEIERVYPHAKVTLLVKGNAAAAIFKSYTFDKVFQLPRRPLLEPFRYLSVLAQALTSKYDLAFNAIPTSSSGRLFTAWAQAKIKYIGNEQILHMEQDRHSTHMAKSPVYAFRKLVYGENASTSNEPIHPLDIRLTKKELAEGHRALRNFFDNGNPTIALYTYATRNKIYSTDWWNEFHKKLKHRYPNHNIIEILPIELVSQLIFHIPSFYSRDIREIASVIANCDVFIGGDSGVMHLAASSGTPTVGLFKVTALDGYAPYGNGSFGIDTNKVDMNGIVAKVERMLKSLQAAVYLRPK